MRVLFTGGGTGGHFFPIIAIAREIRRIAEDEHILDAELFYIGPTDYGKSELEREDIVSGIVPAGKWRRYASIENFFDIFRTFIGIFLALWKVFVIMPDVVFSKGGYAAFPILVAARIYRIPIIIHESDAIPGVVNRWSGKFARRIGVSFEHATRFFPGGKTAVVGNPIRTRIIGGNPANAKEDFSIFSGKPVVLIIAGSQGAEPINRMIIGRLEEFAKTYELIHQTGEAHFADIEAESSVILSPEYRGSYHPIAFLNEVQMRSAYAAADIIIARPGSTIFEIAASGKPSVLIPLPHAAQDHQRQNANIYTKAGAAIVVEENNATPNLVLHTLGRLFAAPRELQKMSEAAKRFARTDAAHTIAKEILNLGITH